MNNTIELLVSQVIDTHDRTANIMNSFFDDFVFSKDIVKKIAIRIYTKGVPVTEESVIGIILEYNHTNYETYTNLLEETKENDTLSSKYRAIKSYVRFLLQELNKEYEVEEKVPEHTVCCVSEILCMHGEEVTKNSVLEAVLWNFFCENREGE